MLDAITLFSALGVVEAVKRTYQIAGNPTDAIETDIILVTAAVRASVPDDAVIAADWIPVDRMVD